MNGTITNEINNPETIGAIFGAALGGAVMFGFVGYSLYKCYQNNVHESHQRIIYNSSIPRNIPANEQEMSDLVAVVVAEQPRTNATNAAAEPLDIRFPTRRFYQ